MRRKIALTLFAASALAGPVLAQPSGGTVTVDGFVTPKCLFTEPSDTIFIPEMSGNDGKLDPSTVDGQTAQLVGWCNSTAAVMFVDAAPLLNIGTPGPNYDNRVDYTATAAANSVNADDSSLTPTPGSEANVGLFAGDVIVTLSASSSPGGKLLLSGEYSGTVIVTLAPAAAPGEVND
jgi:hypothetical protein